VNLQLTSTAIIYTGISYNHNPHLANLLVYSSASYKENMSERVVPQNSDGAPVTGLAELLSHLTELHEPGNESAPLNNKLFDDVELQLTRK
jgi:hypothetical protein